MIEEVEKMEQAAKKVVDLCEVLPQNMWGKSIIRMMSEGGVGHAALEKVGLTGEDLLTLKIAGFLPKSAHSRDGFTLRAIAAPCATYLAHGAFARLERIMQLSMSSKDKT